MNKILILAPRRSHKTSYILSKMDSSTLFLTITSRFSQQCKKMKKEYENQFYTRYEFKESFEIGRKYEKIIVDEYMNDNDLLEILCYLNDKYNTKIILITTLFKDTTSLDIFKEKQFNIINAPVLVNKDRQQVIMKQINQESYKRGHENISDYPMISNVFK